MRFKKSFRKMLAVAIAAGCFAITFSGTLNMSKAMGERRHLAEQHAERVERERTERLRDKVRIQERQGAERKRQYEDEVEQRRAEGETRRAQEDHEKETPKVESREEANINVYEQKGGLTGKAISEAYFDKFIKNPPKFQANYGEGGDLAGLSSILYCSSSYSMNYIDTGEYVSFSVMKGRSASFYGADTSLTFSVYYNLQTNPIVSKKRQPIFELQLKGVTTTIKLKKISNYSDTGFMVHTGNVHLLDELYVPGASVTLLLSNEKNEIIRIPIAREVIEQWQKVSSADLKKMKREYEER